VRCLERWRGQRECCQEIRLRWADLDGQPKNRSVLISATGRLSMRRTPSKFTAANRLAQRSSTCSTRKPCAWFVPAMGALHRGHSIFVNPSQFNDPSEYCARRGCAAVSARRPGCLRRGSRITLLSGRERPCFHGLVEACQGLQNAARAVEEGAGELRTKIRVQAQ
jgi:hypothetical protein